MLQEESKSRRRRSSCEATADRTQGVGDFRALQKEGRGEEGCATAGDAEGQVDEPRMEGAVLCPGVEQADQQDDPHMMSEAREVRPRER